MNQLSKMTVGAFLLFFPLFAMAQNTGFTFNPQTDTILTIDLHTPPALLWVVDSNGLMTGANPNLPVDAYGMQESTYPNGPLTQIPNSNSMQTNLEDDDNNDNSISTFWENDFVVNSPQIYTVNLLGITTGIAHFRVTGFIPHHRTNFENVNILLQAGATRQITVNFNTQRDSLSVDEVVAPGDLLNDVKMVCSLGYADIRNCRHLEELAEAITDAINDHHCDKERLLILQFIDSLDGCRGDIDFRRLPVIEDESAQEMALRNLMDEAKALLVSLSDCGQQNK